MIHSNWTNDNDYLLIIITNNHVDVKRYFIFFLNLIDNRSQ